MPGLRRGTAGLIFGLISLVIISQESARAQVIPAWWHALPSHGGFEAGDGSNYGNIGPGFCGLPQHGGEGPRNSGGGGPAGAGNPVDLIGGSPQLIILDAAIPANGPVPLAVSRSYHNGGLYEAHWDGEGVLGPTWFMNWDERLVAIGSAILVENGDFNYAAGSAVWVDAKESTVSVSTPEAILHIDPLGVQTRYEFSDAAGAYHPVATPELARGRLEFIPNGSGKEDDLWELELADGLVKTFDVWGKLVQIDDPQGRVMTLTWDRWDADRTLYLPVTTGVATLEGYFPHDGPVARAFISGSWGVGNHIKPTWLNGLASSPVEFEINKWLLQEISVNSDPRTLRFNYTNGAAGETHVLHGDIQEEIDAYLDPVRTYVNNTKNSEEQLTEFILRSFGHRHRLESVDLYDDDVFVDTLVEYLYSDTTNDEAEFGVWPDGYGVEMGSQGEDTVVRADRRLIGVDWWGNDPEGLWDQAYVYGSADTESPSTTNNPANQQDLFEGTSEHEFGAGDNITALSHILQARYEGETRVEYIETAYAYDLVPDGLGNHFWNTGHGSRVLREYKRDPNTAGNPLALAYTFGDGSVELAGPGAAPGDAELVRDDPEDGGGIGEAKIDAPGWTNRISHALYSREDADESGPITWGVTEELRVAGDENAEPWRVRHMAHFHANHDSDKDNWQLHGRVVSAEEFHLDEETPPPFRISLIEYDETAFAPATTISFDGTRTDFTYNADRTVDEISVRRIEETEQDALTVSFGHDSPSLGLVTSVTDPLGNSASFEYDSVTGHLRRTESLFSRYERIHYGAEQTFDGGGVITSASPVSGTDPFGRTFILERGHLDGETEIPETRAHFVYDDPDDPRLVTQIAAENLVDEEEPLRISHFAYDSEGRLVVATDPLGHSTLFEHNVFGQVVSVENALGSRTEYTYDRWGQRTGRGQRASASDPLTREITWEHDFIGRVIRETRADGQHTEYRYAYDDCGCSGASLGRITAVEIFDGQETSLRRVERLFNDEGELIETSWGGESGTPLEPRILRSYVTEPPSPTGDQWMRLLAHVEDEALKVGDSRTSFTYDSRGRLIAVTDPDGAETSYDYDAFDRRTRVQDPDGNATEYEWNSDGTLAAVHNGFGQTTSHSYDPDSGRLSTASNANGTSTDYTYNGWGQLKSVTHRSVSDETLAAFYYLYDDLGLPSKIEFEDYRYVLLDHDVLGQLTAETWYAADDTELWSRTYDYDAFGNRTEVTLVRGPASSPDDTEATTSTFNELDQLVSDGSRTFTYDAFGNLTSVVMSSELVWAYSHDARTNQLLRARLYHSDSEAAPLQDVHMLYDPLGRRMLRWDESRVRTRTFYDGFNTLLEREMRPRRLKVQDDFHREPYQYWNASTPKEDFGPWSPYEAFIGGLPEPYPSNWDGYYNLDGNPSLQAENLILYYGSGPSESPALPHAPAIAHDLIEPVTDPFLWAGADSQTRGTASVPKPTLRLVFGWRDADGDFIHDAGDDAWAAGLEWGDGDLYWFVDRWGPNDNEWGREASTSTSFAYEDTNDPEPEPFAVDVDSTVPGVDGTRITVHAWDSTNMVWDPVFSHDTEDPIPAGRVGFQGEVPYAGSGDPPSRSAGATPFWVWNWGAIASMVRTDGDFVEERLLETNNAASDEADYEVYDDSPSGADVAIAYSSDRLSNVLVFDGAAGADHVQTWSGTNPAWYEDNGTNLTFQFRATDSPPVTDRPQFLVQLRCDVDGDGGVDSRYLTYVVGDGSDTTNAPTHTTNKIYLDPALADGTWQTFSRDVRGDWLDLTGLDAQDLTMLRWRGNLELDTLRLTTSTTRRVHTNAPTALGGTISVREVDEETGANSDTWLHHDRMGSVVLQTDAAGSPLLAFPATGRVVEAASGSGLDPRWRVVRGNLSLESSDSLAALLERPEAQALTGTIASGDSNFQIIAGEQSGWYGNSNDDEWNEATSHIVSLALSREANVLMTIRGQQSSGEVVEINLRFGSSGDSTYTGGSGYPGVNHYEDIPAGVWGHAAFDAAEVIREQYGESVDLAEIDAISVWGYGKTEIADLALLGTTHAAYTAWGESLASAQTGDLLSPLAQAAAWLRAGETSPIGWQSKALDPALGLHFNHARFYSAGLGRFTQASPLGADFEHLYGYGLNSPLGFTDIDGFREVAYDDGFGRPVFADEMRYREGPSDVNTGWQVDGRFVGDFAWEAAKRAPRAIGEEIIWTYTGGKLLKWAWWLGKGGWRLGRYCLGLTDEAAAAAARAQGAGAAAAAAGSAGELSGQVHHAISRRIHRALESHPNLSGRYSYRDPRFATQARDLASHSGYQRWHIDLDDEIVDWIRTNPTATPQQFEAYLQGVYRRSEIMQSFPNAL